MTVVRSNPDLVVDDALELSVPQLLEGRAEPFVTAESEPFWSGLARNEIVLLRCDACARLTYVAAPGCPFCGAAGLSDEAVDGSGTLYTFTVCYSTFGPGMETPYVVGVVSPGCEPDLRIVTNIVGCRIRDVRIGMALEPTIVPTDSGHLLLYRPEVSSQ